MTFILISITMIGCSTDKDDKQNEVEGQTIDTPKTVDTPKTEDTPKTTDTPKTPVTDYNYSNIETEIVKLINKHRLSIGLKELKINSHISEKCREHNKYMVQKKGISHDNFSSRAENIMKVLKAKKVGENVAYNYKTAADVVKGWLNSPGHKENIEGDFTHFGIAVMSDASGNKYFTNIFAKI